MNFAHPYQSPTDVTNFFACFAMMVFPFSLVLMYGRMLHRLRHAIVIFAVMLLPFIGTIVWAIYFDTLKPHPGLTAHAAGPTYVIPSASAPGGLDLDVSRCKRPQARDRCGFESSTICLADQN